MNITVKYFAALADSAGKDLETLETTAQRAADLYEELKTKYGFSLSVENVRAAVNHVYVNMSHRLQENDIVVFIPPVSGG